MGWLTNRYVSDKRKRFWIGLIKDIILLLMLLLIALNCRYEFDRGLEAGLEMCNRCSNPYNITIPFEENQSLEMENDILYKVVENYER